MMLTAILEKGRRLALAVAGLGLALTLNVSPAGAANDAEELVLNAKFTAEHLLQDPNYRTLQTLLAKAKGVLIFPSLLKAGFFFGAEGGSGVLLSRNAGGSWSYPAFFTLGAVSLGFQWGGQDSEVIFVIMTDRGLNSIMEHEVKLGADASVAVGPVGVGAEAATTAALADMYSFSRSRGAYAGVSFEGAVIHRRNDLNEAYYGQPATAGQIVTQGQFSNPQADGLRSTLNVR